MASPLIEALKKTRTEKTPFGFSAPISEADVGGLGDMSIGGAAFVPSRDPASRPHELAHAGVQQIENMIPGGTLIEALLSRLSDRAYGSQSAYRNPLERFSYGYQEATTGVPDVGFAESGSPEAVASTPRDKLSMTLRNLLDLVGSGAEAGGRYLGRR